MENYQKVWVDAALPLKLSASSAGTLSECQPLATW